VSDSGPCWLIAASVKILLNCFIAAERWKLSEFKDCLICQCWCGFIAGSDAKK